MAEGSAAAQPVNGEPIIIVVVSTRRKRPIIRSVVASRLLHKRAEKSSTTLARLCRACTAGLHRGLASRSRDSEKRRGEGEGGWRPGGAAPNRLLPPLSRPAASLRPVQLGFRNRTDGAQGPPGPHHTSQPCLRGRAAPPTAASVTHPALGFALNLGHLGRRFQRRKVGRMA